MRLTPTEQQVIRNASLRYFGVRPRLFGSRVDDSKLGGDIDLYIEAPMSAERGFDAKIGRVADIWMRNALTHEYPERAAWQVEALNQVHRLAQQLLG